MNGDVSLPPGYSLLHVPEIASTNQLALETVGADDTADKLVVWADKQTAGRGRHGRNWESPEGNLFTSIVLRPDRPLADAAQLSFVAALAVADVIRAWSPTPDTPDVTCKWPNDILIGGRKCAGILLEAATGSGLKSPAIVIGIGINLDHSPVMAQYPATSVAAVWRVIVTPGAAVAALTTRFDYWAEIWRIDGFPPIRDAWQAMAHRPGEEIRVRLANAEQSGMFAGIDDAGALRLETSEGVTLINAGDVYFPDQDD